MSQYRITDETFINPYNFVSIGDEVARKLCTYGTLSGSILCELETLTPLFIPNTTRDHAFGHTFSHSYDFFSYEDLTERKDYKQNPACPIIPGSSIRGMVRSAFEAVTNSCMVTCDEDSTLYRRTPVARDKFGILQKDPKTGERVLYEATKHTRSIAIRDRHQTGETLDGGIYLRGEDFSGKNFDAVMHYVFDANQNKVVITRFSEDSREWNNLVEVWRLYQQKQGNIKGVNQNRAHTGYRNYLNADCIPVYYAKLDNGDFYYLSPAAITKEVFSRTLSQLLEKQGGHNPCQNRNELCRTCSLFGMVGSDAQASRLFFRDATPTTPVATLSWSEWYDEVRVLPILSGPKVSATEFYMQDIPGTSYFNYDYTVQYYRYTDSAGRSKKAAVRSFLPDPKLRGRKFYWHRKSIVQDATSSYERQRTEIRPVRKGKKFQFEIGFDRLTQEELQTLLWVLTFGEHSETHAHKLGHAKPYGYGSVCIGNVDVSIVTLDDNLKLTKNAVDYKPQLPGEIDSGSTAFQEYLKLTNFFEASDAVKYPLGDNGKRNNAKGIYQWFGINKEIRFGGMHPAFNYVLPTPLDKNGVALPCYAAGDGPMGGNRDEILPAAIHEKDWRMPQRQTQVVQAPPQPRQPRIYTSSPEESQLREHQVVTGTVTKIVTAEDGTPKSAAVAIDGCSTIGLIGKTQFEKNSLSVGTQCEFTVTKLRDDGKGANLKPINIL